MTTVTVAASNAAATAAMVVSQGDCSGVCLVSKNAVCTCDCGGRHHGKLADVPVPGTRRRPPRPKPHEPALFEIGPPDDEPTGGEVVPVN